MPHNFMPLKGVGPRCEKAFRAVVSLRNWAGPGQGWKPGGSLKTPSSGWVWFLFSGSAVSGREPCQIFFRKVGALKVRVTIYQGADCFVSVFVFEVSSCSVAQAGFELQGQSHPPTSFTGVHQWYY